MRAHGWEGSVVRAASLWSRSARSRLALSFDQANIPTDEVEFSVYCRKPLVSKPMDVLVPVESLPRVVRVQMHASKPEANMGPTVLSHHALAVGVFRRRSKCHGYLLFGCARGVFGLRGNS